MELVSFAGSSRASETGERSRWGLEQAGQYGKHWVWDPSGAIGRGFLGGGGHNLNPTVYAGIGGPEATEWKWAENGVRGERRPKRLPLVAQTEKNLPARQETRVRSLVGKIPWRKQWQPSPGFMPEKSRGQRSLAGYSA